MANDPRCSRAVLLANAVPTSLIPALLTKYTDQDLVSGLVCWCTNLKLTAVDLLYLTLKRHSMLTIVYFGIFNFKHIVFRIAIMPSYCYGHKLFTSKRPWRNLAIVKLNSEHS